MDPLEPVRFVKHGCVCFESDDAVVYVDPYKVPDDAHDADLIVITHSHGRPLFAGGHRAGAQRGHLLCHHGGGGAPAGA